MKLKKGDKVYIELGKDSGKNGVIKKVMKDNNKVIVGGINIFKKHAKAKGKESSGGIIEIESPINASNVMVICPNCGKTTRISYKITKDLKERVCKKCNQILDKVKS